MAIDHQGAGNLYIPPQSHADFCLFSGFCTIVDDIVYKMSATTKPILLKGVAEILANVTPTIGDDCREVHTQAKQYVLLQCKSSNNYLYTTIQDGAI